MEVLAGIILLHAGTIAKLAVAMTLSLVPKMHERKETKYEWNHHEDFVGGVVCIENGIKRIATSTTGDRM